METFLSFIISPTIFCIELTFIFISFQCNFTNKSIFKFVSFLITIFFNWKDMALEKLVQP